MKSILNIARSHSKIIASIKLIEELISISKEL